MSQIFHYLFAIWSIFLFFYGRISQPQLNWHSVLDNSLLWGPPVCYRVLKSIPSLYLLYALNSPLSPVVTPKMSSNCQMYHELQKCPLLGSPALKLLLCYHHYDQRIVLSARLDESYFFIFIYIYERCCPISPNIMWLLVDCMKVYSFGEYGYIYNVMFLHLFTLCVT